MIQREAQPAYRLSKDCGWGEYEQAICLSADSVKADVIHLSVIKTYCIVLIFASFAMLFPDSTTLNDEKRTQISAHQ